jgi:hypothetical protein
VREYGFIPIECPYGKPLTPGIRPYLQGIETGQKSGLKPGSRPLNNGSFPHPGQAGQKEVAFHLR